MAIISQMNFLDMVTADELQSPMDDVVHEDFEVDNSYTVQELLYKYSFGGIAAVSGTGLVYDDEPDIDHPDPTMDGDFDLADYYSLSTEINARIDAKKQAKEEKLKRLQSERDEELKRLRNLVNQGESVANADDTTK